MKRVTTNAKHDSKASIEAPVAPRGSSSSSLARIRFFASLCALPLISLFALWVTAPASAATWPVPASALSATVPFHQSYSAGIHSYVHSGIDIPASAGMQISSPVAGTVRFTGAVPSGDSRISGGDDAHATMNAVSVQTPGGKTVTLMPFDAIDVREGEAIAEGARLGSLAASGDVSSPGAHLHMGYKEGGRYLDPMLLFGVQPTSVSESGQEALAGASALGNPSSSPQASSALALDAQLQAAPSVSAQGSAALDSALQAQPESFGSIETGSYALKARSISQDGLLDGALASLRSLGDACSAQAGALLDALALVAQATAIPLPVLAAAACALAVMGALALGIVALRFLAPRVHRTLQASKRFLVFAERGW